MSTILVTGASGFVGGYTVPVLRALQHAVITTDKHGDVDWRGDLTNKVFVASLPDVDHVVHLASVQYVTRNKPRWGFQKWFYENNVVATANLASRYPSAHFVYMATSMVFKQVSGATYTSRSARGASGPYGRSKLAAVDIVENLDQFAILFPCIIVGRGREGLFRPLILLLRRFGLRVYVGTDRDKISIVDVRDVAMVIGEVISKRFSGHLTISSDGQSSIKTWGEMAAQSCAVRRTWVVKIPVRFITAMAAVTGFRIMHPEQVDMIRFGHHVAPECEAALGVSMRYSVKESIAEMAGYIV